MKILILDDSIHIIELLKTIFSKFDYEIHTALTAIEALYTVEKLSFDLIISDLNMPDMNGIKFALQLRKTHPNPIIIFFSGEVNGQENHRISLKMIGNAFFIENKDVDMLIEMVTKISSQPKDF